MLSTAAGVSASSLRMMSNCSSPAIRYMLNVPYFELLATSTTCEADCIATCLTSTFRAEGVVRPRRKSQELVEMKAISVTT
ncbi:hypothetical protein D3C84_414360 [compost metagenome]